MPEWIVEIGTECNVCAAVLPEERPDCYSCGSTAVQQVQLTPCPLEDTCESNSHDFALNLHVDPAE